MILGFLLAVAYDPYIFNAATTPRWALLAAVLPAACMFRSPSHCTMLHLIGTLFLAWTITTLAWTPNLPDAFGSLIRLAILAMAFMYGTTIRLDRLFAGLALGLMISSLIVMSPLKEFFPHPLVSIENEGLFGNRNMLAEAAVLTLIGCIAYRAWIFIPGLAPAILIQPISRGALLGGLVAFGSWLWSRSRPACAAYFILLCIGTAAYLEFTPRSMASTEERLQLWQGTIAGLSVFGHGIGSFYTLFPFLTSHWDMTLIRPEHAHNDLLEIAFETGLIGAILSALFAITAIGMADTKERAILVAFLTIGLFSFPISIATTGFIAAIVAGHVAGRGASLRIVSLRLRMALRPWLRGHHSLERQSA